MQINLLHKAGMAKRPTKHTRLREARERMYATAKEAAAALGVPYGTYSGHELGSRGFNDEEAARYGRFFRVRASWIVFGESPPASPGPLKPLKRIIQGGLIVDVPPDPKTENEQPSIFLNSLIEDAVYPYKIHAYEMLPWFQPGTLIVCSQRNYWEVEAREILGVIAIHGCEPRLAIARPGSGDGIWNVEQFGGPHLQEVRLDWLEEVLAVLPSRAWAELSGDPVVKNHYTEVDGQLAVRMHGIGAEQLDEPNP